MGTAASEVRSVAFATSDLLLAAVGLAVICYPAVFFGNALLGAPLSDRVVRLLVGVLAFGGAYPFVAGDWSYHVLGSVVIAFLASAVGFELLGAVVVAALGLDLSGSNPVPRAVAFAAAYVLAYAFVHRRGDATAKRTALDS